MRRAIIGALWGMLFYLVGSAVVGLIVGRSAVDAWQPLIALVAATLASAIEWTIESPGEPAARRLYPEDGRRLTPPDGRRAMPSDG